VTLAERLSIAETRDALASLESAELPVRELIVNRVEPSGAPCALCDARRAEERRAIAEVSRVFGRKLSIRLVGARAVEPRGLDDLERVNADLIDAATRRRLPLGRAGGLRVRRSGRARMAVSAGQVSTDALEHALSRLSGAQMLLFGGKGGVGKTTVAASVALHMAEREPDRHTLLLSTDPAPSLGDIFGVRVGDEPRFIRGAPPNLFVRELDAPAVLASRRAAIMPALDELAAAVGAEAGVRHAAELFDLAPPGLDELFGLVAVAEWLADQRRTGRRYDLVIVDTAPTGHALRLLEMPGVALDWVQTLMRVVLKYRAVVRPGALGADLLELSRQIRALEQLIHDPRRARFVVVTRASVLPRVETERLLSRLRRMRIDVPLIVVNARTLEPRGCRRCRARRAAERRQLTGLRRVCGTRGPRRCDIIHAPLTAPPPHGITTLRRWARAWVRDGAR
jgi:arsenite-transporting ATPase